MTILTLNVRTLPMRKTASPISISLRSELIRQGRTQTDLATHLGRSLQWVNRRTTGTVPWSAADLAAVAKWLDIPLAQLIGEDAA